MNDRQIMNGKPVFTVPAKTVINFDSRFDKKLLCDGITFTAGSACTYSCSFCYVPDMQRKAMEWHEENGVVYPEDGHMGVVIRIKDAVALARKQLLGKPAEFRMAKKVIYSSPKVDVAGNMDLVRETVDICNAILELTNWDIRLLSKSNLLPKVATMLGNYGGVSGCVKNAKERVIYGVSTGTLDDKLAAAFEAGTPKVSKRIESLHWLQDNGFRTFGMICPSLPMVLGNGEEYLKFSQAIAEAIRVDQCEHVWAEVINVRGESFLKTEKALDDAGFHREAAMLNIVSHDKKAWEDYSRRTFMAHTINVPREKLRFLQYVNKDTEAWWEEKKSQGAVLL